MQGHVISKQVQTIHDALMNRGNLRPCDEVNALFSELVNVSRSPMAQSEAATTLDGLLADGYLENLWQVCAAGESELEKHWAQRILCAQNPKAKLREFPYYDNYLKLTRMEVAALRKAQMKADKRLSNILFAGSGPLPLTSVMLNKHYGFTVTNLDRDCGACDTSEKLVRSLELAKPMPHIHANLDEFDKLGAYDAIYMAALVGLNVEQKLETMNVLHTRMSKGQFLIVRSAKGMRRLLYPEVFTEGLNGFKLLTQAHPRGEVINSVLVFERV